MCDVWISDNVWTFNTGHTSSVKNIRTEWNKINCLYENWAGTAFGFYCYCVTAASENRKGVIFHTLKAPLICITVTITYFFVFYRLGR